MTEIQRIASGAIWEDIVGYSRAVIVGNTIEVAGTTYKEGKDEYEQTIGILNAVKAVLEANGSSLARVIRTRIFCTNIDNWEAIGRAHGEYFKDIKPAATMVEVSRFVSPEILVEIEFTAVR